MSILLNEIMKDSPVGYWPMDETSGSTMYDRSGRGNNGTYTGSSTLADRPTAVGRLLNNSGGDRVGTINPSNPSSLVGAWTVSAWVYSTDRTGPSGGGQDWFGTRGPVEYGVDIKFQNSAGSVNGGLHADVGSGGNWLTTSADCITPSDLLVNTLYHVVFQVNTASWTWLVNGVQVGAGSLSGTPLVYDGSHTISVGSYSANTAGEFWKGSIGHLAVYPTKLSADRVLAQYQAGLTMGVVRGG